MYNASNPRPYYLTILSQAYIYKTILKKNPKVQMYKNIHLACIF